MNYGQLIDVLSILMNLGGLMLCLFRYFEYSGKPLMFAVIFFLGNLLSNYYWGVYLLVMTDYPDVSSLLAYFGWNIAFAMLFVMLLYLRREREKHKFSIFAFLPVLTNVPQLILYLQFGGVINNVWQVFWTTAAMVLALDSIIFYLKNRKNGVKFPYIDGTVFIFLIGEYIAWTSSCYGWPSEWLNPYNYSYTFYCICYILIPLAYSKEYGEKTGEHGDIPASRLMKVFRPLFIIIVTVCCIGGYILAVWMRETLRSGIRIEGSDPYSIIAVTLFIVSTVIVSFTIMIILVVNSERKNYEQEELKAEKFLAERANSAKSDFLANMSHEIRTPINAVLGMNEMILRDSLQARDELPVNRGDIKNIFSEICNYSGNIDSAGKNLLSIINDILDFSKIEAGKLEIVNKDYKLSSVLNDVCNMISFKAKAKGLEYKVEVDESIPDGLKGDEVRVRQIITNILNNAVKYTEKGSVILSVSEKKYRDDMSYTSLVISVKDTGMGIKPEDRERLFKKFERMDIEKNSTIEGTGLGLAITGSLVEMMQGKINVESEYGHGSTFTVTLPQTIVSREPIGDFREKFEKNIGSMKAEKEHFHAPNAYILVVDDTPMNLTVVKGLLKKTMINIDTATSGPEAIELARYTLYDIILMDQRMPEMDGTDAMFRIKGDVKGQNANTPFICLTADAVSGAKERYIAEGFSDYLSKPIDSHELEEILLEYLPSIKVEFNKKNAETGKTTDDRPLRDRIDADMVDYDTGLRYCDGDEEFYTQILSEYVAESDEKIPSIEEYYNDKDWQDYGILVHSLKSTSKMIGASELSKQAENLEKAAKNGDIAVVEEGHEGMLNLYRDTVNMLRENGIG